MNWDARKAWVNTGTGLGRCPYQKLRLSWILRVKIDLKRWPRSNSSRTHFPREKDSCVRDA